MPGNDIFDDMKAKLDEVLEYAIIAHDNTDDQVLEERAVSLYICVKSFLDNQRRIHQWYESARLFMTSYDEDFPGIRAFALEYLSEDHDDDLEELAGVLENVDLEEEKDSDEDEVFLEEQQPDSSDSSDDETAEDEEDDFENLDDDLDFDRIIAFFD